MPSYIEGWSGSLTRDNDVKPDPASKEKKDAERLIREKILWLVPNWSCNRKCPTCFAADVMKDAETHGYQKAGPDFFKKAEALTQLPWKEVIITGGEPTQDRALLAASLEVVDPKLPIRIVTNGDWILREKERNQVLSIVNNSKRKVQIDISAHDKARVFEEKIDILSDAIKDLYPKKNKLSIGAQLRRQEGAEDDYYRKLSNLNSWTPHVNVEEHDVLELGRAVEGKGIEDRVRLYLSRLINYSNREQSLGVHLMPGSDGSRVVVNHEAPYLSLHSTPADIVSRQDPPETVKEKVLRHYSKDQEKGMILDDTAIGYAEAAFRSGVPIFLDHLYYIKSFRENYLRTINKGEITLYSNNSKDTLEAEARYISNAKKLMDVYYQRISETSDVSVDQIKEQVLERIVNIVSNDILMGKKIFDAHQPILFHIASYIPKDTDELNSIISHYLFDGNRGQDESFKGEKYVKNSIRKSGSAIDLIESYQSRCKYENDDVLTLNDHLKILGLSNDLFTKKVKEVLLKE